jgi:hypothetical protein
LQLGRIHLALAFTVSYLRDSLSVHIFLYAFFPDNKFNSEVEFLERYPGDEWVDLAGMDNYGDFGRNGSYQLKFGRTLVDKHAAKIFEIRKNATGLRTYLAK